MLVMVRSLGGEFGLYAGLRHPELFGSIGSISGSLVPWGDQEDGLPSMDERFGPEDFEITEVYRFEGNSDPADEAVVYGIESNKGHKGILVNGYGPSSDPMSSEMAKKLSIHQL